MRQSAGPKMRASRMRAEPEEGPAKPRIEARIALRPSSWPAVVLLTIWTLALVIAAPAAFRIDEPNILAIAQRISVAPLDPDGFRVNWNGQTEPAYGVLANPPLVPAWLALVARVCGWRELPLHLAM